MRDESLVLETAPATEARPGLIGVWWAAVRPKTLAASFAPVGVGTALAAADGQARYALAALALLGALLIQIGTNLFNDLADFRSGADAEDRLGPARAAQKGWLSQGQLLAATILVFLGALAIGGILAWFSGWPLLVVGLISVLCGFAYTGGPYPLAYVGLGDVFVLLFFGFVAVAGTYYAQTAALSWPAVLAGLPVGALATAILVVNNLRDRDSDARAGKRTLVVRFGPGFARGEYLALILISYALLIAVWLGGLGGAGWLLPLLSLPLALVETAKVFRLDGAELNPRLAGAARLSMLFSLLLALGVLL